MASGCKLDIAGGRHILREVPACPGGSQGTVVAPPAVDKVQERLGTE